MKNKWMIVLIGVIVILGLTAMGLAQEVKNPDTLIIADYGTVNSLDPAYAYDTSSESRLMNIYEPLIFFDGEETGQFVTMLANKVPTVDNGLVSADGMTYIFPIREGVKFHNEWMDRHSLQKMLDTPLRELWSRIEVVVQSG